MSDVIFWNGELQPRETVLMSVNDPMTRRFVREVAAFDVPPLPDAPAPPLPPAPQAAQPSGQPSTLPPPKPNAQPPVALPPATPATTTDGQGTTPSSPLDDHNAAATAAQAGSATSAQHTTNALATGSASQMASAAAQHAGGTASNVANANAAQPNFASNNPVHGAIKNTAATASNAHKAAAKAAKSHAAITKAGALHTATTAKHHAKAVKTAMDLASSSMGTDMKAAKAANVAAQRHSDAALAAKDHATALHAASAAATKLAKAHTAAASKATALGQMAAGGKDTAAASKAHSDAAQAVKSAATESAQTMTTLKSADAKHATAASKVATKIPLTASFAFWGHSGRPGERGGSEAGDGGGSPAHHTVVGVLPSGAKGTLYQGTDEKKAMATIAKNRSSHESIEHTVDKGNGNVGTAVLPGKANMSSFAELGITDLVCFDDPDNDFNENGSDDGDEENYEYSEGPDELTSGNGFIGFSGRSVNDYLAMTPLGRVSQ